MDAVEGTTMLYNSMAGPSLFFLGVGVLWFVSVHKGTRRVISRGSVGFGPGYVRP